MALPAEIQSEAQEPSLEDLRLIQKLEGFKANLFSTPKNWEAFTKLTRIGKLVLQPSYMTFFGPLRFGKDALNECESTESTGVESQTAAGASVFGGVTRGKELANGLRPGRCARTAPSKRRGDDKVVANLVSFSGA